MTVVQPAGDLRVRPLVDAERAERVVLVLFGGEDGEHRRIMTDWRGRDDAGLAEGARLERPEGARLAEWCPMATVKATASKSVSAPPARVLEFLRDYREGRPLLLTENYSAYRVEQGGEGAGTVIAYHFAAGGRERDYRLRIEDSGDALLERDEFSSFVSTWRVAPDGSGSKVTLEASWQGAGGIGGFFEKTFAPLGLRRIYDQVLSRLERVLQPQPGPPGQSGPSGQSGPPGEPGTLGQPGPPGG